MPHLLKNKIYLYLTEFFAGMSVMAVELGASRLLAPYFSSSQIVWTIIIGTIMIAMALGNIYGGRTADRDPNPDRLYRRILIAAVWIAMIPVLGKYVILGISALLIFTVNANYLIWAAFAACMVIFVFPLFLLGTVTPSLAKYTMDTLEDNAGIVGMLGAANTVGSIIGTFVPTFLTIPAVGTSISFLIFAGILLVLALLYFISVRKKPGLSIAAILLFLLSCVLGWRSNFAFWKQDLLYEGESIYNYLQVEETDDSVILSTNVLFGVQSIMRKDASLTGMYYDYAMAAPMMAGIAEKTADQKPFEMLILGMGTGTYGSQCAHYYPAMHIEGVEIDDKIIDLAYDYFELPENVKVTEYDGRAFRKPVSLEEVDVQASVSLEKMLRARRAAGDHEPEPAAELLQHHVHHRPAQPDRHQEPRQLRALESLLDLVVELLDEKRHGAERRRLEDLHVPCDGAPVPCAQANRHRDAPDDVIAFPDHLGAYYITMC